MTDWNVKRFDDLTPRELYAILKARQMVFVVEQQNPFLDLDDYDIDSFHLWSVADEGFVEAYCRIIPPGFRYHEASFGRVLVHACQRHNGKGTDLIRHALCVVEDLFPAPSVRIGAAGNHVEFYESLGFRHLDESFIEDGIHLDYMMWSRD